MEELKKTLFDPRVLTAAGGVVISLVLVYALIIVIQGQNEIVGNHIDHSTKALLQLEASIAAGNVIQTTQVQVLRDLTEVIRFSR